MNYGKCIISGYVAGAKFRPSNWSERLCEAGASFDPMKRVMRYSANLYPRQCDHHGCSVYVDFDALDIEVARHVGWFIDSNDMEVYSLEQPIQLKIPAKRTTYSSWKARRSKAA